MHGIGRSMLEMFVNADGGDYRGRTIPCDKGHQYEFIEFRDKKLLTVLGPCDSEAGILLRSGV